MVLRSSDARGATGELALLDDLATRALALGRLARAGAVAELVGAGDDGHAGRERRQRRRRRLARRLRRWCRRCRRRRRWYSRNAKLNCYYTFRTCRSMPSTPTSTTPTTTSSSTTTSSNSRTPWSRRYD